MHIHLYRLIGRTHWIPPISSPKTSWQSERPQDHIVKSACYLEYWVCKDSLHIFGVVQLIFICLRRISRRKVWSKDTRRDGGTGASRGHHKGLWLCRGQQRGFGAHHKRSRKSRLGLSFSHVRTKLAGDGWNWWIWDARAERQIPTRPC